MSTTKSIRTHLRSIPKGKPFTSSRFATFGPGGTVGRALARLVERGEIERVARGVFVRPRKSRYVGNVLPGVGEVVHAMATASGETVQMHGAEAARRLGLTTQTPVAPVYHTSASSRSIKVGNTTVRMVHTSNPRRLQFAGEEAGLALAALWYVGRNGATVDTVEAIRSAITPQAFEKLRSAQVPAWMGVLLHAAEPERAHA